MTYASVDDVAVDYGAVSTEDTAKVATLLERAEARIRQVFPDLDTRLADGRTNLVLVKQVESEMVCAVLRNPQGYTTSTTSNTAGPYSQTLSGTLSTTLASGLLRLTRQQRELLGDPAVGGAFTVAPGNGHPPRRYGPAPRPWRTPNQWWPERSHWRSW